MTESPTLRAAIVVHKRLEPAAAANAAAILMGQLAHLEPRLYAAGGVVGLDGVRHAGIRFDTVVLTGRPGQVEKLLAAAVDEGLPHAAFSAKGRELSNSFEEYRELVARSTAADVDVFAVGVVGEESRVRALTKPFSSYRGAVG
ncbi:DUF2000 family protein [Saccharothrix hoggarensis]|uniref:DUF2000 family protein n=1 Tax=Saccharothrix hoggarensis TaxID=913853 RepID=A0ABW3QY95_9PSEU